ncbi:MAG: Pvc16 family protein, partial [Pseudomonadota bacterium]
MPVPVSSLSVAVQGIADFLNTQFDEDVRVAVNTPQAANEAIKGNNQTVHCLNIFPYRVAPSGFHPDIGSDETQFIRINALLTPFPDEGETEVEDTDLRILGHAIRVLHSNPVLPVNATPLPGPAITDPPGRKDYRLQAILLAPPMEELNHIWTTQGGELAYRLSAAYEFALIPIEPIEERVPADPPRSAVLGLEPQVADGPSGLGAGGQVIPLSGPVPGSDPGTTWLPLQLLVVDDALTNTATVAPADTEIDFA